MSGRCRGLSRAFCGLRRTHARSCIVLLVACAACDLELGAIPVRPDDPEMMTTTVSDAGSDASPDDADTVEPVVTFRDDFERPDGPADGPGWKDVGPGTPEIWAGELCLSIHEQARTKLAAAPYGHVQFEAVARGRFELHFEGVGEDILAVVWQADNALATASGAILVEPTLDSRDLPPRLLTFDIDYEAQVVSVTAGDGAPMRVPFESKRPQSELMAVRFAQQSDRSYSDTGGRQTEGPVAATACVDNFLVAESRPARDPFGSSTRLRACMPDDVLIVPRLDCSIRNCCDEYGACDDWDHCPVGCMLQCLEEGPSGTVAGCQNPNCQVSNDIAQALADCLDEFCARDGRAGGP
jgi:hypothetical protein